MPLFRSKAQIRWAFATHPDEAKKWLEEAKEKGVDISKLPDRVPKKRGKGIEIKGLRDKKLNLKLKGD